MKALFDVLEAWNSASSPIAGWELASDRGNLSASEEEELAEMKRREATLREEGRALWDSAAPEAIATYDRLALAVLSAPASMDAELPILEGARPRVGPTRSPERAYDPWAIWATLKVGSRLAD